jgi:hypothetical protein
MSTPSCPEITGKPVIDAPAILEWPLDGGVVAPSLHAATSNVLYDLHANIDNCDLVLSTEGNFHMVLHDIWPQVLAMPMSDGRPLQNVIYSTSPPVVVAQLENGTLQFDNLRLNSRPSVAVATKSVIDRLTAKGLTDGAATPLYQDRGVVILVKRGNPKAIRTLWDLGRAGVRLVTPNPELEPVAFDAYLKSIFRIAQNDAQPPREWTAAKLIDTLFNGKSGDNLKWLAGERIHHRDAPWSVAYGRADAAVIYHHIGRYTWKTFPDIFDIIPLGGTVDDPRPLPGTGIGTRYIVAIKGDWAARQREARDKLIGILLGESFTAVLEQHGLQRALTRQR